MYKALETVDHALWYVDRKVFLAGQRVMAIPPEERKALEKMGEARVRSISQYRVGGGLQGASTESAVEWIDEKDKECQAEQMRLNKSTLKAAWIAAIASIIGIAVTVAVSIFVWDHPRH